MMTPKWLLQNDNFKMMMIGGRTVWSTFSLDYGWMKPIGTDGGLPWLSLGVRL